MAADDHGKGNNPKPETSAEEALRLARDPDARPEDTKPAAGDGKTVVVEDQVSNQNIHYGSHSDPSVRLGGAGTGASSDGVIVESGIPADADDRTVARNASRVDDSIADPGVVSASPAFDDPKGGAGTQGGRSTAARGDLSLPNDGVPGGAKPQSDGADPTHSGTDRSNDGPQVRSLHVEDEGENDNVSAVAAVDRADDPVVDAENVSGDEDSAIALNLSAVLSDTDGSETLAVTITGVPDGAALNHGTDLGGGEWSVEPGDLGNLAITPPAGSDADFTLTLNATATDGADAATVSRNFSVTVDPVNQIVGTNAGQKIKGTDGDDYIDGAGGNDTITGSSGDDRIIGGAGTDKLYGGAGDDTFEVGAGHGYDRFSGDGGNDRVVATGDNVAIGLDGHYDNGVETISAGSHSGVTVTGTNASQKLDFSATTLDGIAAVDGAGGNDTITGSSGDDRIIGGAGKDKLYGSDGNDTFVFGFGDGKDTVDGGAGGSWSDVIQLEGVSTGPGEGDWTIRIDSGAIAEASVDHLILTEDAAGTITLSDGSSVNFEGIERIEW